MQADMKHEAEDSNKNEEIGRAGILVHGECQQFIKKSGKSTGNLRQ